MALNTNEIKARMKQQEGSIDHMYLDTRGFVTVGVGQLLASEEAAAELGFIHRDSGAEATRDDIINEYRNLKSQQPGLVATRYREFTQLMLPEATIDAMLEQKIDEFSLGLQKELTDFDGFPDAAKEGLLDMAFNLGLNGLMRKFPSFIAAAKRQDWNGCAAECHRNGIGESRNELTVSLFKQAAQG